MKILEALRSIKRESKYALIGDEPFLKNVFIDEIKKSYPNIRVEDLNDKSRIHSALRSNDLYGDKVFIFRDFDELFEDSFPDLIKSSDQKIIAVLSDKSTLKSRVVTKITTVLTPVECFKYKDYGEDYPMWISTKINSAGYLMEEGVGDLIFSLVGPSLYSLNNEIKKLFLYKTEDKKISKKDVQDVVSVVAMNSAFNILGAILEKNTVKIFKNFDSYLRGQNNFGGLVFFLQNYTEKMYRVFLLKDKGTPRDDIANIIGIPPYRFKIEYYPKILNWGRGKIEGVMGMLCNLDAQIRLFKGDKRILFDRFFLSLKDL